MAIKKIRLQAIKILKMVHIFFAFEWIIGGIALCLLLFITCPQTGDELYMRSRILQIVDDYFIIPGAICASITGLIYNIWTNWGFIKHLWIIVKWAMAVIQGLFGLFVLVPCIDNNVIIADRLRYAALADPEFVSNIQILQILGTIQSAFLVLVIVISVQKPWKEKKILKIFT
jgi:hypothetical protein